MIFLELSVREAITISLCVKNIEQATVHTSATEEASLTVYSMDHNKFIECNDAIRDVTRWGLRKSKEFFDVISNGTRNTLCGFSRSDCEKLCEKLRSLGCDCSVSR